MEFSFLFCSSAQDILVVLLRTIARFRFPLNICCIKVKTNYHSLFSFTKPCVFNCPWWSAAVLLTHLFFRMSSRTDFLMFSFRIHCYNAEFFVPLMLARCPSSNAAKHVQIMHLPETCLTCFCFVFWVHCSGPVHPFLWLAVLPCICLLFCNMNIKNKTKVALFNYSWYKFLFLQSSNDIKQIYHLSGKKN